MPYVPPSITETAFNCPHCGAFAAQVWYAVEANRLPDGSTGESRVRIALMSGTNPPPAIDATPYSTTTQYVEEAKISNCFNCNTPTFWISGDVAWPINGDVPPPNSDMPTEVRRDYTEAGSILNLSPRGAAALLRLAVQKLCKELGQKGKNIDEDIKELVKSGLNPIVQKALDTVRVIGNDAVHPGQIDLRDDRRTSESLFLMVNLIVEKMISEPKQVDEIYALLPEGKREHILKRDRK